MANEQGSLEIKKVASKVLRPVLIASEDTISEYSFFLHRLLTGLADESVPVALVCPGDCDAELFKFPGVEIIRYPDIKLPLMGHYNRKILIGQLGKFRPGLVHCLCESQAMLTRHLARHLDVPYVMNVNSLHGRKFGQLSFSSKRLAKIMVPAESIAADVARMYPRFTERIERINIGTFVSDTVGCFRKLGQVGSIVIAADIVEAEEFLTLFGAIKHLATDGQEFMLLVMVDGRAEKPLREMLGEMGLSQIVTIIPKMNTLGPVLEAGDVFVRPLVDNAFNPLLLEAMGAGAAVAGCKGGVDDLMVDGQTCVVFDPEDELSIYDSLRKLFNQPEFARNLAKSAQQHLRENHSVSKMISAILKSYR